MNGKDYIFIKHDKKISKVYYNNITYIESNADYCTIYTTISRLTYSIHISLDGFINYLPKHSFCQCHRRFIVNVDNVSSIMDDAISVGEHTVLIGEFYKKDFFNMINCLPTTSQLKKEIKNGK